jgi:hypothetical protein
VPTGCIYLSFPLEDDELVDKKVREVAGFVASLVRSDHVLVRCTEGSIDPVSSLPGVARHRLACRRRHPTRAQASRTYL